MENKNMRWAYEWNRLTKPFTLWKIFRVLAVITVLLWLALTFLFNLYRDIAASGPGESAFIASVIMVPVFIVAFLVYWIIVAATGKKKVYLYSADGETVTRYELAKGAALEDAQKFAENGERPGDCAGILCVSLENVRKLKAVPRRNMIKTKGTRGLKRLMVSAEDMDNVMSALGIEK